MIVIVYRLVFVVVDFIESPSGGDYWITETRMRRVESDGLTSGPGETRQIGSALMGP